MKEVVDWLDVDANVLYCSVACAQQYGGNRTTHMRKVYKVEYDRIHALDDDAENDWSAVCACGREYHGF